MSNAEALERGRRSILLSTIIGFGVWQSFSLADELIGGISRGAHVALRSLSLAGWAFWCIQGIRLFRWSRRVRRDQAVATALQDERVQLARARGFVIAFWAVMVVQVVPMATAIPAWVGAQLTILVGVTVAIGAYLVVERA